MHQRVLSECLSRRGGDDVNRKCHSVQAANLWVRLSKRNQERKGVIVLFVQTIFASDLKYISY